MSPLRMSALDSQGREGADDTVLEDQEEGHDRYQSDGRHRRHLPVDGLAHSVKEQPQPEQDDEQLRRAEVDQRGRTELPAPAIRPDHPAPTGPPTGDRPSERPDALCEQSMGTASPGQAGSVEHPVGDPGDPPGLGGHAGVGELSCIRL